VLLVIVLVLVLGLLLLLGGGLGHELFESHEIALFLGVSCCLYHVVSIAYLMIRRVYSMFDIPWQIVHR
jgi:hypothetical protein